VALLDREPRSLQLQEATFLEDAEQSARFRQLCVLDWQEPGERLLASSLAHAMLDHALLTQVGLRQGLRLKGGLAPLQRKRVRDFIEQHLDTPLPLSQLAALCALSEYHFARMFQTSFGLPPHRYVLTPAPGARLSDAASATHPVLSEVALACGFASASHFSNRFRQALGATPRQYRAAFET
jgi:AraC family transcriptional regulator